MSIDMKDIGRGYWSALAGIATDGTVAHLKVTKKAINAKKFIEWLRKLRQKLGDEHACLYLDNLAVHKTPKVLKTYEKLQLTPIFSSTYDPNGNPAESIFGQVKKRYKEKRLNLLANGKVVDEDALIR